MPRKNDSAPNHAASRVGIIRKSALWRLCRARHKRHTFCSHSFMTGTDAVTIQGLMGHENILTTMRYAHVTPDHVREAMERLSYDGGS